MHIIMNNNDFITATPESVGIPSVAITKFIRSLQKYSLCMHGILIFRRGKLVAEGYAPPYHAERKHRMYSISKSFTALGIGLLAEEGKISLGDRIVDHYPEYVPGPVHPFIADATIRDMLTMRDCHDTTLAGLSDWFSTPPTHPPGTVFMYNTTCTNLLCGIVEKISGVTLMEYLYPRLLAPIGFTPGCVCIKGSWGYSWSGSGILCAPRDLARVALLCMNGGSWGGKQLIGERFIREAVSRQVDNAIGNDDAEHQAGYGYQIWRTRFDGFAFLGMGSQLAVAAPDRDLLLVTTADTQDVAGASGMIIRTFFETVAASLSDGSLPEDAVAQAGLEKALGGLELVTAPGTPFSPVADKISGKTYRLFDSFCGWRDVRFEFADNGGGESGESGDGSGGGGSGNGGWRSIGNGGGGNGGGENNGGIGGGNDGRSAGYGGGRNAGKSGGRSAGKSGGRIVYSNRRGDNKEIPFGFGAQERFSFPETHYPGLELGKPAGRGYEAHASAGWVDERTLSILCYITDDYCGSLRINAVFDGNRVTLFLKKTAEFFLDDYEGWCYGYC